MDGNENIISEGFADKRIWCFVIQSTSVVLIAPPCRPVGTDDTALPGPAPLKADGRWQAPRSFPPSRRKDGLFADTPGAAGQAGGGVGE